MKTKPTFAQSVTRAAPIGRAALAALVAGVALSLQAGQPPAGKVAANAPAELSPSANVKGISPIRISPYAAQQLRQHGKTFKDPAPNSDNNGFKWNRVGGAVGPLTTDPVQKLLVIFVEFTTPPPGGPETRLDLHYFDNLLFGTVYDPPEYAPYPGHPTDRTLRNYIKEVSYGKVDVVTVNLPSALGWAQCGKPYDYYCRGDGIHDYGYGPFPENSAGLVIDAIKAVDPVVDFSQYAVNGEVPNLIVVHAGSAAEWNVDPNLLWSHESTLSTYWTGADGYYADGVKLFRYALVPELGGDVTAFWGVKYGPYPPTVGVFAHEWAHVLGLPDQYDYGYESAGTGNYSPMANGGWCFWYPNPTYPECMVFLGNSPTHLDAWSKYRLGFVDPIKVEPGQMVSGVLPPVERAPAIYRMDVPYSGGLEYFLLENRQPVGFDQGLMCFSGWPQDPARFSPGAHGLAIWHIDDIILTCTYWRPNEPENWKEFRSEGAKKWYGITHYGISIIQADDQWHLERDPLAVGDPADLYPGTLGVTRFGNDTFPNSSSYWFWKGSDPKYGLSGVTVDNITEVDGVIRANLFFAR